MKRQLGTLLLVLMVAGVLQAAQDNDALTWLSPARTQLASQALENLQDKYPVVQTVTTGALITRVYGQAFGHGSSPEVTARQFVEEHAAIFGVEPHHLIPGSHSVQRYTSIPMMYNEATDSYKFTLVYYSQYHDDAPVFRSELRLLVRNEPGYPLVLAVSSLHDLGEFVIDKRSVGGYSAIADAAARIAESGLTDFSEQTTVIWAGVNGDRPEPKTAVMFTGSSDFPEDFLFVVDPATGEVLYKEDLIIFEDVSGHVSGLATEGLAAEHCEEEVDEAMPWLRVNIGASWTYTDSLGDFLVTNFGTSAVDVEARCRGQWFRVFNNGGTDLVDTVTAAPPGPANFLLNSVNTEYERAQVNAYVEANTIRSFVLAQNPTYPTMDNEEFPIYVNRNDGYCPGNAWYSPSEVSMNFCIASSGYPNTAWSSVLHHEYGHHLVNAAGSGQDQYGEGMSDCMAVLLSDDPNLGLGFFGDCGTPLRTADNTMQYPCSNEAHACAPLLSGCIWDTRNELAVTNPTTYLDILSNLTVNSILLHTGDQITPQITIDFLTLDDDDANLDNGTPHHSEICAGFGAHNMDCPELTPIWFEYPDGRPDLVLPGAETSIRVIVHAGGDTPVSGSASLFYSVNGAPFVSGTVTINGPNDYNVVLPAAACDDNVDWYVTAEASSYGTVSSPSNAPTTTFSTVVATGTTVTFEDDCETNLGWSVSGSVSDGAWERGTPIGGGDRGDPPTDYDGSGQCYLTDNVDDNSDVDDGTTILTSPLFDGTVGQTRVSYARWYSNHYGADPYNDVMEVHISNNDGGSWELVETVGPIEQASGGWYEHSFWIGDIVTPSATMRLRFEASDLGSGSVVEAAVDAISITTFECTSTELTIVTTSLPEWTEDVAYSQQLQAINVTGEGTWADKYDDLTGTGLTVSSDGLVSGTPTDSGTISFTVEVTDEIPTTDEQVLTIEINSAVQVDNTTIPNWTSGAYLSQQLTATGGTGDKTFTDLLGDLSGTGLSLSTTGFLSGTPSSSGLVSFTVQATDEVGGTDEGGFSFTINPELEIATTAIPDGHEGKAYSFQLELTGGTGPTFTWSDANGDLPANGLQLLSNGNIIGTPTAVASVGFTATVTDLGGGSDSAQYSFNINPPYICGDVNNDGLGPDIEDLTVLISYLYISYEPPEVMEAANVDGSPDGFVDNSDLTMLIGYLFIDVPELNCL